MKLNTILILAGLLSVTSISVFAEEAKEIPDFKKVDVDKSKSIDDAEFAAATAAGVKKSLKDLDTDKDGKLSRKEYSVVLDADCE
ncbi:MAG: EF-hand domain-containing protein [Pseudomonadota bacterium]|nr:EF-hand domain-containing protein [Pseudomonadota bacterium]